MSSPVDYRRDCDDYRPERMLGLVMLLGVALLVVLVMLGFAGLLLAYCASALGWIW